MYPLDPSNGWYFSYRNNFNVDDVWTENAGQQIYLRNLSIGGVYKLTLYARGFDKYMALSDNYPNEQFATFHGCTVITYNCAYVTGGKTRDKIIRGIDYTGIPVPNYLEDTWVMDVIFKVDYYIDPSKYIYVEIENGTQKLEVITHYPLFPEGCGVSIQLSRWA